MKQESNQNRRNARIAQERKDNLILGSSIFVCGVIAIGINLVSIHFFQTYYGKMLIIGCVGLAMGMWLVLISLFPRRTAKEDSSGLDWRDIGGSIVFVLSCGLGIYLAIALGKP